MIDYLTERVRGASRKYPITISRKTDLYLTEHLPDLMDKYKLTRKRELKEVDKKFEAYESDVEELEDWKSATTLRVDKVKKNIERLEFKHGVK